MDRLAAHDELWWRDAVIYEVYLRSFTDGDGDGVGDLAGVRSRLDRLRELGVDAIWFTPWYLSPMADGGYDVTDHRAIDPGFGTLAEAEELVTAALAVGIRTIVDVVPNHVSDQHPWFQAALAAAPGSPERARFWFHPGRGPGGDEMPTHWPSMFGGDTWTRAKNADGTPGEWYLHLFSPGQPDLNWSHPDVRREHEDVLRFWFDRGVAGVRIDSAALLVKDPALPEILADPGPGEHPNTDRDELHEIYRGWREIADSYPTDGGPGRRILVGEIWLPDVERFGPLPAVRRAAHGVQLRLPGTSVGRGAAARVDRRHAGRPRAGGRARHLGAVQPRRDAPGHALRPCRVRIRVRGQTGGHPHRPGAGQAAGQGGRAALGCAARLALPLPQGDELGLPEYEELDDDLRQDPMYLRSGGIDPGREGCRVPLPWSGDRPPFGFSPPGAQATWLPQPAEWAELTVAAQEVDPGSMLALYRAALRIRRAEPGLGDGPMDWLSSADGVLGFRRGPSFTCVVNLSPRPAVLPAHTAVLLASAPLTDGELPRDTAAWLRPDS